jgi:hypothetical protein
MNTFARSTITAAVLAGAACGLAGTATAAPGGGASVSDTVNNLKANGYTVILNTVGSGAHCSVDSVQPGQTFSKVDSGVPGARHDLVYQLLSKTAYVHAYC